MRASTEVTRIKGRNRAAKRIRVREAIRVPGIGHARSGLAKGGFFAENRRFGGITRAVSNCCLALAQGVEQAQFFSDRTPRKPHPVGALAFENLFQIKRHGESVRNCRSNFCQGSTNPSRVIMA